MFGFGHVNSENVFKVCDEPHPVLIREMIEKCLKSDLDEAYKAMNHLWRLGLSPRLKSLSFPSPLPPVQVTRRKIFSL